jgi:hypothetical protein
MHEPNGEPRVHEVADEDAECRPRHHPPEHERGREAEDADEERGQDDELGDVVEREAEEPVDVPGCEPARRATTDGG